MQGWGRNFDNSIAKCFGLKPITNVAVGCIDFASIVAVVVTAVVAVAVAEQVLALEGEGNGFVRLLGEVERAVVHQAVDCHRIGKSVYHLGAVGRN